MIDTLRRIPYWGFWALLIYMPFHIFLSQSLSVATGGLEVWKVAKDVVLLVLTLFTICLVWQQRRANRVFNTLVILSAAYAALHLLLWMFHPDSYAKSAIIGIIYNVRLCGFLLVGVGAALLTPHLFAFRSIFKVLVGVSTVVALLGVLQFFLPKDLLTHLGYSLERGARAAFYIDDNASLPRIMSTLREPNALGAYLLLPIAIIAAYLAKVKTAGRRPLLAGLLLLHIVALFLTFSRSAWLAAVVVLVLVGCWEYRKQLVLFVKKWRWALLSVLFIASASLFVARGSSFVQHYITHSTNEAVVDLDSNDYHKLLLEQGIAGVIMQPLGHGPGTAGLASIQNPTGGQLTENYYVQIAYEVGVMGLALFVLINLVVYRELYRRHDLFGRVLLAAFWGYVITNMLLHTWSNEAVAAQWWLLAGAALTRDFKQK